MRNLEDMTLLERCSLTVAILVVVLMLLLILPGEAREPDLYAGVSPDARLLQLDRRALDEAYHAQLLKLFNVWLTDGGRDPTYFQNGLRNARRAYGLAATQIAKREQESQGK